MDERITMEKAEFIKLCELSMIAALPEYTVTKPGKLRNRLAAVHDMAMNRIEKLPRLGNTDMQKAFSVISGFECELGWLNRPKHPLTITFFCSFLAEDMGDEKLTEFIIVEIIGFLDIEKRKSQSRASLAAGKRAYEKWQDVKERL